MEKQILREKTRDREKRKTEKQKIKSGKEKDGKILKKGDADADRTEGSTIQHVDEKQEKENR